MTKQLYHCLAALSVLLCCGVQPLAAGSFFGLLAATEGEGPLPVSLGVSLDSLHKYTRRPQPATLRFRDSAGQQQEWSLNVEVRGKYRRVYCECVPLRINFSKKALRAAGLEPFDKYKLVVPCHKNGVSREEVIKEYLAYSTYNQITQRSFRVRLLSITYQDPRGHAPDFTAPAFIIESNAELAFRLAGTVVENTVITPEQFAPAGETTNALFQHLIGNKDWSLAGNHNMLILRDSSGLFFPVPFDFDFSGWVKASYARPNAYLGQETLEQRLYFGYAWPDAPLLESIATFVQQRQAILDNLGSQGLSDEEHYRLVQYVKSFYDLIEELRLPHKSKSVYGRLRGKDARYIPIGETLEHFRLRRG